MYHRTEGFNDSAVLHSIMNFVRLENILFWLLALVISSNYEVQGTLMKKQKSKNKLVKRPPGVPYNNKKMPLDCQVCRVVTEEIENMMNSEEKEMDGEEEKKRKRENRRKKKKPSDQKLEAINVALRSVCDNMKDYVPQDDRTKFRYISKKILLDTKQLTLTSSDPGRADKMEHEFNSYKHPETSRLEEQCKTFIRAHKKDILSWQENTENSTSLLKYVCEQRFLQNDPKLTQCLTKESARDDLWIKTFDSLKSFQHLIDEL